MPRIDTTLLSELNCGAVLAALRGGPPRRLAEISEVTGLSRPTVGVAVERLVAAGWVEYAGEHQPAAGRPAKLARFRNRAGWVLGIDVGAHRVTVALADLDGEIHACLRRPVTAPDDPAGLAAGLGDLVDEALAGEGLHGEDVLSVAVATPGIVLEGEIQRVPSLPGLTSDHLRGMLEARSPAPVQVQNDANLAVLGERWRGAATDADTVALVQWGSRLGIGILIGGRLHRGAHGAAGEIGHMAAPGDRAIRADDTGLGPFERSVNAEALVGLVRQLDEDARVPADPAEIFAAALRGDTAARHAVDTIARRLARGLAPVVLTLDPDVVVLAGGLSQAGKPILDRLREQFDRLTLTPCEVTQSTLSDQGVVVGAVRLALDDVEARLLPRRAGV